MRSAIRLGAALTALSLTGLAIAVSASAQVPTAVSSGALRALDAWQVGQVPRDETPLPSSLWRNSDAAQIGPAMDKLTGPYVSPAATRLARAALLSGGEAPAGSEIAAGEAARKRFAALGRFGAADEIAAMANVSPEATADPSILTFAAQADLARGRAADACRRTQSAGGAGAPAFILRLRAFCFANNGDDAGADLAADVARGAGVNDFWLFSALPAVSAGGGAAVARFDSSLNAAVSLAGKLKTGAKPLLNASILALDVVARTNDAPPLLRAEAAQIALKQYAIEPRIARDAFMPAMAVKTTAGFAASLKAVAAAEGPTAKALAIESALKKTVTLADYVGMARLLRDDIAALPRDASTSNSAFTLARASLAIGDVKAAAGWRDIIAQAMPTPGENARAALDLAIIAAGEGGEATAQVALERRLELGGANAARDAMIIGALGAPTPPSAAAIIAAAPVSKTLKIADPAIVAAMVSASQRGAMGETAILASRVLGPGAHMIDRASLVSAIQSLRAVGLDAFARQAAVEAMIGPGIA